MKSAIILGLMSGTSLDGLDLCLTQFDFINTDYKFKILKSESIEYPVDWQNKLRSAAENSGEQLSVLSIELAKYHAQLVNEFLNRSVIKPDYIASHGHTVFHQPEKGMTHQIVDGATLFAQTGIPIIYDFRSLDVALGGQGAPLVPIGDLNLFSEYIACINFGGIANISFQKGDERLAYDICPVNMALSDITSEIDLPYDDKGKLASSGNVNSELLSKLSKLPFYVTEGPKSLGIEWYQSDFQPLIKNISISVQDRLRTVIEHIAVQNSRVLNKLNEGDVLVSGGGVYNSFLIEVLQLKVKQQIIVPSAELIEFKEALIFAFIGWLRINNKINVLKTVTGANSNSCSGLIIKQ